MRKIYLIIVTLLFAAYIFGQVPNGFKYQLVARNQSGQLILNTQVTIQIAILKGSINGTPVYIETFSPTTNNFGIVNLTIGSGTVVSGNFSTIDWGADNYFIKVLINSIEIGINQLLSVPYALYSKKAETISSNAITGNEIAFTGWDKNSADDFNGNYNSLTGIPTFATVATSGSYSDLTNKPTLFDGTWTSLTGKPIFATVATSGSYTDLLNKPVLFDGTWTSLTGKPTFAAIATSGLFSDLQNNPTTLAGYGITNAMSTSHPANTIISTDISNWNTAFGWGNHAGLYRPISYVPTWGDVTGRPNTLTGYGITDAVAISGDQIVSGNKTFAGSTTVQTPQNPGNIAPKTYVDKIKNKLEDFGNFVHSVIPLPKNGLIGYYPFNGNANDETGNGNNGTVDGAVLAKDRFGNPDRAYYFDGMDDDITGTINNWPLGKFPRTISLWGKLYTLPTLTNAFFLTYGQAVEHSVNSIYFQDHQETGKKVIYAGYLDDVNVSFNYALNTWYHIVASYDGSVAKIFVDGVLLAQETKSNWNTLSSGFHFGNLDNWTSWLNGMVDDVRIYNRVLSEAEMQMLFHEGGFNKEEIISDVDGNSYNTVRIGTQIWMSENLKTTNYKNGDTIPYVTDMDEWRELNTGAYCWYNDDPLAYKDTYGALYNWHTVNTENLCPTGWHIPTVSDWTVLIDYLGGEPVAGGKIKEAGTSHWNSPNTGATNESGFTALPGGFRDDHGFYVNIKQHGYFWSSTPKTINVDSYYYLVTYLENSIEKSYNFLRAGFSVRCIKDPEQSLPFLSTSEITNITANTATAGGHISYDGGAEITARGVCWSTSANPTLSDNKTMDSTGAGTFTSSITGLSSGTTYYVRAYATNSEGTAYGNEISFTTLLVDIDGNSYKVVKIGDQIWMAENLKTIKYNDGSFIPLTNKPEFLTTPAYCWYNYDSDTYKATYGALYNGYTVNTGKLCPIGWHVPTDTEWTILTNYLGGESIAGGKLKEFGTSHWITPNTGATNESDFTALPAGFRSKDSVFGSLGYLGDWWTSTDYDATVAWYRNMSYDNINVFRNSASKRNCFSVRCLKD